MVTLQEAKELDNKLDDYIARTIYFAKHKNLIPYKDYDDGYYSWRRAFTFGKLPLEDLWHYSNLYYDKAKSGQLYAILQDIKISLVMAMQHYYAFVVANNAFIGLASEETKPLYRMEMYNQLTAFILKYRALWDKFMNALVYLYYPKKYIAKSWVKRNGSNCGSRKEGFANTFCESEVWFKSKPYIDALHKFDNEYRTPEAHLEGRTRRFILFSDELPLMTNYCRTLLDEFFNPLVEFVNVFWQLLDYARTHDPLDLERVY